MARVVDFKELPAVNVPRSHIKRNTSHKTTFNEGEIVPIYVDEVLPSDTLTMDLAGIVRMATPLFPVMDDCHIDIDAFFVPNRLTWSDWEKFCGEAEPNAWTHPKTYTIPTLKPSAVGIRDVTNIQAGSLYDHLGLPSCNKWTDAPTCPVSILPFRAYQLIYNNYYRDENLQPSVNVDISGDVYESSFSEICQLRKSCRYHDYFSSCLPAPQKGAASMIPLSGYAPVAGRTLADIGRSPLWVPDSMVDYGNTVFFYQYGSCPHGNMEFGEAQDMHDTSNGTAYASNLKSTGGVTPNSLDTGDGGAVNAMSTGLANLWANLSEGEGAFSINDLRSAVAVQRLLELDARGGTRYRELVKSHFGCETGDARVQVPEYLGHFHTTIQMNQVVQTSGTSDDSPIGSTGATSKTVFTGNNIIRKTFVEHGYIMVLATVRVARSYAQGIPRMWTRSDKYDFYYPVLANIGEQPVYTQEIYGKLPQTSYKNGEDPLVFGYQEAWSEYRYKPNSVSGLFSPQVDGNLSSWTYSDYYSSVPFLSEDWIVEGTSNVDNTLAVTSNASHQFIADFAFNCDWYRPMPLYSIPSLETFI